MTKFATHPDHVPRLPYLLICENDGIQQDINSAVRYKLFHVCGKTVDHKNNKALFKVAGLKHRIAGQPSYLSKLPVMRESLSAFACKVHVCTLKKFLDSTNDSIAHDSHMNSN